MGVPPQARVILRQLSSYSKEYRTAVLAVFTVVALVALAAPARAAAPRPRVAIAEVGPLVIRGIHFRPHERVTVVASFDGRTSSRRVTATRVGSFRVRFRAITVTHSCGAPAGVSARGDRGSRAALKLPMPQCPPPVAP